MVNPVHPEAKHTARSDLEAARSARHPEPRHPEPGHHEPGHHETIAHAKINLALRIHGRRTDGYHEIETLIAFVAHGDRLRVASPDWVRAPDALGARPLHQPMSETSDHGPRVMPVHLSGPFAGAIDGANLIDTARRLLSEAAPHLAAAMAGLRVELEKHVPVAAGLGGGSADAAAFLRSIQRLFPEATAQVDWLAIASRCGADVPACLKQVSVMARGTGTTLSMAPELPKVPVVLVNAMAPPLPQKTPRVFKALAALPCPSPVPKALQLPTEPTTTREGEARWFDWLGNQGNDLEQPSMALMPEVAEVLTALRTRGAPIARLSGAGPTCIAIFPSDGLAAADHLAQALASAYPKWWVCRSALL